MVLDELLLGGLLGRDRRDGLRAVVVGVSGAVHDGDRVVAVEPEAARLLVEAQAVFLEVDQQRLVEAAALERRRGRRHLQARKRLSFEPQPDDLDGSQGLGAAVSLDGLVEHGARLRLRELGPGFGVGGAGNGGGGDEDGGDRGAQHGGSPWKLAWTLGHAGTRIQPRCAGPCVAIAKPCGGARMTVRRPDATMPAMLARAAAILAALCCLPAAGALPTRS